MLYTITSLQKLLLHTIIQTLIAVLYYRNGSSELDSFTIQFMHDDYDTKISKLFELYRQTSHCKWATCTAFENTSSSIVFKNVTLFSWFISKVE